MKVTRWNLLIIDTIRKTEVGPISDLGAITEEEVHTNVDWTNVDRKIPDREGYVVYVEARRIYIETVLYDFVKPVVQKVTMPGIIRAPITAD